MFFINPFIYAGGGDFESIATVTVGSGGASSIEFTSIPTSTYQHLQLRGVVRESNRSDTNSDLAIQFNSDTTAGNYVAHWMIGNGTAASAGAETSRGNVGGYRAMTAANATASAFGGIVLDILDYSSTSKNKVVRSFNGHDRNGAGILGLVSGAWLSTNAITSMKIYSHYSPGKLAEYSTLALYGVRA